ncbi:MAG: PqqD family protein [Anaerolineales bacterium]|nr:PqqD family protein [Anaerolineales bacterium]
MDELNLNSTITRNEDLLSGLVDDEAVIMSIESGSYHVINETGRRIWELLEQPKTVAEICDILSEEFDVDRDTCQKEVLQYIEALRTRQVVLVS